MSATLQEQLAVISQEVVSVAFRRFEQKDALELGKLLLAMVQQENLVVAIGVDLGEQMLFRACVPGTTADYQTWIERKFKAVRRFNVSSMELELNSQIEPDFAAERALDPARYALCGGALPLRIGTTLVGCIGCAGLASIDDHKLVLRAIRKYQKEFDA